MIEDGMDAVFITSPTYEGKCSDIREIAKVCHGRGIPLIVDAAHGAHFGIVSESGIPENAVSQGADLVIHSVHKTLPAMTQTALLHVQGNLVDRKKLRRFLAIYQSSSPSYVLMSSIDLCMKYVEEQGAQFAEKLLEYREILESATRDCRYLEVPGKKVIPDAAKVLIYVKNAAMTGQELYDILREEYKLQLEMAGERYALAIISGCDTRQGIDRLAKAIKEIDAGISACKDDSSEDEMVKVISLPEAELSIQEAWDADKESVDLCAAVGRISGEFINLYPPGIPLIVPGERFSEELVSDITKYFKEGLRVQGLANGKEVICVRQK
ncbi:MAG: PLP-dependent transferase [Butyrivibrio sp.]|nr:PLP-dependent transferase [Butyrivibrio sp.]